MRKLFKRYDTQIGNLIHITDHDNRLVGDGILKGSVGAYAPLDAPKDTLALILFTGPRVLILWGLLGRDDDVFNLMEPLGVSFAVLLKKELFGTTHVVDFSLDKYETIHVPVENLETKFKNIILIIKHKRVYEHLYLK
jgi:hypothetical protein